MDRQGASYYLGVSRTTLDRLVTEGKLVPVKLLAHTRLFDRQDLDAMVERVKANA